MMEALGMPSMDSTSLTILTTKAYNSAYAVVVPVPRALGAYGAVECL